MTLKEVGYIDRNQTKTKHKKAHNFSDVQLRPFALNTALFEDMVCEKYPMIKNIPLWDISTDRLNINMSYQYRDPHAEDKRVSRPSYL